jgi:hypothetical protein
MDNKIGYFPEKDIHASGEFSLNLTHGYFRVKRRRNLQGFYWQARWG